MNAKCHYCDIIDDAKGCKALKTLAEKHREIFWKMWRTRTENEIFFGLGLSLFVISLFSISKCTNLRIADVIILQVQKHNIVWIHMQNRSYIYTGGKL